MAIFLMATVSSLMLLLLFPSLWMWRAEQAHSEVQQGVLMASKRLEMMLLNCQIDSLTATSHSLSFQQVVSTGPGFDAAQGNPILESAVQVVYYDAATRRILHKVWSAAPPALGGIDFNQIATHLVRLTPAHINQVALANNLQPRSMSGNVEVFDINDADNDLSLLTPPLSVRIRCQMTLQQSSKQEGYEMTLKVTPRSVGL